MSRIIAVDFETFYSGECSVKTLGNWAYTHHPDWEAYMVSVCDGSETWVGHPKEFNWRALEGAKLVSHNAFFDRSVYRRLVELNQAPDGLDTDWHCSSNLGAYLCGSQRSLKDVSEKLLGVDLSKDVRDQAKGLRWSQMQAEGFADKMLEYARRDAHLCHQIWDRFSGRMPESEHQLSDLTIRNSMFGIRINRALLEEYISALRQGIFATEKQIPWIAEDYKPTSTKAFAEWCRRDNIPVPPTKEEDEEGVDKWTELYSPGRPWVQAVGAWRSLNKTLKRFLLIQSRLRPDDTMDFGLKYFGAHCVTGDHEVLTETGWQRIDQWSGGSIAQWNPDTGSVDFLPAAANRFEVYEPLVSVTSRSLSAIYTRGHTIPHFGTVKTGKFRTCEAAKLVDLNSALFIPVSGVFSGEGSITEDQLRVLVAVQADGHFTVDGILQFCLRKPRKIQRIQKLLRAVSLPFTVREFPSTPGQVRVSVARRDLPQWLTADRKAFGPWLLDTSPRARQAFCSEVLFWDGYQKTSSYYSASKGNVEWVSTIAHLSGYSARVRTKPASAGRAAMYWTTLRRTTISRISRADVEVTAAAPTEVFCPSTNTGFWLVRHGGKIHVTGNTGRYSGDAGFNIQNQRKQPILLREDWTMVTDKFEVDQILKDGVPDGWSVIDERSLIIPREGHKFIIADLSQIEPRVLNTLVGNHELLDKIRSGMAIYEAFARQSLGYSDPAALKKKDARLYALAKAEVLGLGYQCGKKRFPEVAWIMAGLRIDEAEAEKAVNGFRETNPKIVGLWNTLDTAFKQSCGSDFEMELPSGRTMRYEKVRASRRIDVDEETGLPKAKTVYTAEVAGRRVQLYGGKLTENCLAGWTRVLSERRGWVRLDSITLEDRLWDGVEFVSHSGLSAPRERPVITRFGVTATPDHNFWAVAGTWVPFGSYATLAVSEWLPVRERYLQGGCVPDGNAAEVFDVVDCGPRHRFAVLSTEGVLLAHNCTQAVARDIFVGHLLELDKRGLNPLFSVHDEAVCEVPTDTPVQAVLDVMSQPPAWFPACPVAAEAVEANRYLK